MKRFTKLERPIIILGPPRSGTTVLGEILSAHPDIGYFEEPRSVWRWGNEGHSDVFKPALARNSVREHIHNYFSQRLEEMGKPRLLEKTPQNCLRPQFVDAIFPDARYIVIIRDPYETIASIAAFWGKHTHGVASIGGKKIWDKFKQTSPQQYLPYAKEFVKRILPRKADEPAVMWGPRLPGMEAMVRDMAIEQVAAYQWRECMERVFHFAMEVPDRVSVWSLEALDRNEFCRLLEFAQLTEAPELLEAFDTRFSYESVRRKREVSDVFLSRVQPIISPTLLYLKAGGWPISVDE